MSKFHNEPHDSKGQDNKIYTIVKGRETLYRRQTLYWKKNKTNIILITKYLNLNWNNVKSFIFYPKLFILNENF